MLHISFGLTAYILCITFFLGCCLGSFADCMAVRLVSGQSVLSGRSHCDSCGHVLGVLDLFPVLSWLLLKGKCRYCGSKLSKQYPIVEALNGILYVVVFYATDFSWDSILYCLMTSALIVLSVIDYRTYEIPFGINVFLFVLGVIRCVFGKGDRGTLMIGFFAVSLFLLLLSLLTRGAAIGGGDIKLMAAAGLLLGWKLIILAFVMGCIAGSVVHLFRMKVCGAGRMLALGPYLSVGIFIAALWGNGMIDWYLGLFM